MKKFASAALTVVGTLVVAHAASPPRGPLVD